MYFTKCHAFFRCTRSPRQCKVSVHFFLMWKTFVVSTYIPMRGQQKWAENTKWVCKFIGKFSTNSKGYILYIYIYFNSLQINKIKQSRCIPFFCPPVWLKPAYSDARFLQLYWASWQLIQITHSPFRKVHGILIRVFEFTCITMFYCWVSWRHVLLFGV